MNRPTSSRAYLAFDLALSASLVIAPLVLPRSKRRYVVVLAALGMLDVIRRVLTESTVAPEHGGRFTPSHEMSEAVADPELARSVDLRSHFA